MGKTNDNSNFSTYSIFSTTEVPFSQIWNHVLPGNYFNHNPSNYAGSRQTPGALHY